MPDLGLDEMERAARSADGAACGPWWDCRREVWHHVDGRMERVVATTQTPLAQYLVAAQPSAVLALVAEVRRLRAEAGEAWAVADGARDEVARLSAEVERLQRRDVCACCECQLSTEETPLCEDCTDHDGEPESCTWCRRRVEAAVAAAEEEASRCTCPAPDGGCCDWCTGG